MTPTTTVAPAAQRLLNVERIYFEPAAAEHPRGDGVNLRYRHGIKGRMVADLRELLNTTLPYCPIRYAF
jgi:hypothetical protein